MSLQKFFKKVQDPKTTSPDDSVAAGCIVEKAFSTGLKALYQPDSAIVDIIFVHGLTGDWEKTWTGRKSTAPWPQLLLPTKVPHARVLTFGYDAHYIAGRMVSSNKINDHAENLLAAVAGYRATDETSDRPILFVAHSLGGLVCEDALLASKNSADEHLQKIIDCTRGILFLGTPQSGAGLAGLGRLVAKVVGVFKQTNPHIVGILKPNSEVLARLQNDFHMMLRERSQKGASPMAVTCFYEEVPQLGIGMVVPRASAVIPGYTSIGIHSDHEGMTKFEEINDPGFLGVAHVLLQWTKDLQSNLDGTQPPETAAVKENKPLFLVPFSRDDHFIGREELLSTIDSKFATEQRVALCGIGGVGKSQIAIEYCYRYRQKYTGRLVLWVYAATGDRFTQAYGALATALNLPGFENPKTDPLQLVSDWLSNESNPGWLMILDNADDEYTFFAKPTEDLSGQDTTYHERHLPLSAYLPQTVHGRILLTSRNNSAAFSLTNRVGNTLKIERMDLKDSKSLLYKKVPHDSSSESDVCELIETLEGLPLSITQAGAYIGRRVTRMTIRKYLQLIRQSESILLADTPDLRRDPSMPCSVIRTWQISFNQIQDLYPRAAELLSLMSVLDRQAIPEFLLRQHRDEMDFEEAVTPLIDFSLVNENDGTFSLHRLVQIAMKTWLAKHKKLEEWKGIAVRFLAASFPEYKFENWETCAVLWPHAEVVLSYPYTEGNRFLHKAFLLTHVSRFLKLQGKYTIALERIQQALDIAKRRLGDKDGLVLYITYLHAGIVLAMGRYSDAAKMSREAWHTSETALGASDSITLSLMSVLGFAMQYECKYSEAVTILRQILDLDKQRTGTAAVDTAVDTLQIMKQLGTALSCQGAYDEAEEIHRTVVRIHVERLGDRHLQTLCSMNSLAGTLAQQGKFEESEHVCRYIIQQGESLLKEDHPTKLAWMNTLANALSRRENIEEAINLSYHALSLREKAYGKENPDTLTTMYNIAHLLYSQKKYKEAVDLHRHVLSIRSRVLGDDDQNTLISLYHLARALRCQKQYEEALFLSKRASERYYKVLGLNDSYTQKSLALYVDVLKEMGTPVDEIEARLREVVITETSA